MARIVTNNSNIASTGSVLISASGSTSMIVNGISSLFVTTSSIGVLNTTPFYTVDISGSINANSHYSSGSLVIDVNSNVSASLVKVNNLSSSGIIFYDGTKLVNNSSSLYWNNSTFQLGIGTSSLNAIVHINSNNSGNSNFLTEKIAGQICYSLTPWTNQVYIGAGTYYKGSSWITQNSGNPQYQLFSLFPGTGVTWYANGAMSNPVTQTVTLWNDSGSWVGNINNITTTSSNFLALDGINYFQYVPTGSLQFPDLYFTSSVATGSDSVMGIWQSVATGSSYGILINAISLSSGNAIAISASAGSIIASSFTGSFSGTSSYSNNSATASILLGSVVSASYSNTSSYAFTSSNFNGNSITLNSTTYTTNSIQSNIGAAGGGYSIVNAGGSNKVSQLTLTAGTTTIPGIAQFSNISGSTVGIDSNGNLSASYNIYVSGSITGSITTASYATLAATASYFSGSISNAINAITASYLTGSNSILNSLTASNETVTNLNASNIVLTNYIQNTGNTATNSNIIGNGAGVGSTGGSNNFIGQSAGNSAGASNYANFIGVSAGTSVNSASYSNFIGYNAGGYATNSSQSNFIGFNAGASSTNAYNSNFIGYRAGGSATHFNNAIAIGYQAGYGEGVNNSASNSSILIGDYTLANGFKDSITIGKGTQNSANNQLNIGNSLFINGIYSGSSTTSTPQLNLTVGIGTNAPVNALDVIGNISCSVITASLHYGTSSYSNYSATASYYSGSISNATSASYALTSSYASNVILLVTASTYPITSSWAITSSISQNLFNPLTASIIGFGGININATGSITIGNAVASSIGTSVNIQSLSSGTGNINLTAGSYGNGGQFNLYSDSGLLLLSSSNGTGPLFNWNNGNLNINKIVSASNFQGPLTGSVIGTASWATNVVNGSSYNNTSSALLISGSIGNILNVYGNISSSNVSASGFFVNGATNTVGSSYPVYVGVKTSAGALVYSIASDPGNFTRIYTGPSGLSLGAANLVEDKNSPSADNYYGESTDGGGFYFRGQGTFSFGNQSAPSIYTLGSSGKVGINNNTTQINSLDVTGNISCSVISASLNGTASWATNVVNSSATSSALLVSSSIGNIIISQSLIVNTSPTSSIPALNVESYWTGLSSTSYGTLIQGVVNWTGSSINNSNQYLLNLQSFNPASSPNNNQFKVAAGGSITMGSTNQPCMMQFGNSILQFSANGGSTVDMELATNGGTTLNIGSGFTFGWSSTAAAGGLVGVDTRLVRDAANTIGQRNGGTTSSLVPQSYNLYNYYNTATDKQYLSHYWTGSNFYIQIIATGSVTGSSNINLVTSGSVIVSSNLIINSISKQTGSYALKSTDATVLMSGSSALSASLPLTSTVPIGIEYTIKNLSTYPVIITGSNPIDNQSNQIITSQYTSVTIQSDGTNWWIL